MSGPILTSMPYSTIAATTPAPGSGLMPALAPDVLSAPVPGPIPFSIPYLIIAATAPTLTLPQPPESGFMPALAPGSLFSPTLVPTPVPASQSTITTTIPTLGQTSPAPHLVANLTEHQKRNMFSNAQQEVLRLMFTQSAVPDQKSRKILVAEALSTALVMVAGAAVVQLPRNAEREMKLIMGNVR